LGEVGWEKEEEKIDKREKKKKGSPHEMGWAGLGYPIFPVS
jgi:hypothetical protein